MGGKAKGEYPDRKLPSASRAVFFNQELRARQPLQKA